MPRPDPSEPENRQAVALAGTVVRSSRPYGAGAAFDAPAANQRDEMSALPTVTVIIVNWNGEALLPDCLRSVAQQDYPGDRYRVVVVDNGSADNSVDCVRRLFPAVTVIEAGRNLGFAGGNNLAIDTTDDDYVALLNNDAIAEPDWLRRLVELAESDPQTAAVCSKVLLLHDRLVLSIQVAGAFVPGAHDTRRLSAQVSEVATVDGASVGIEFIGGAFGREESEFGPYRWTTTAATIRIPILDAGARRVRLRLLPARHPSGIQPIVTLRAGEVTVATLEVPAEAPTDVEFRLRPEWVAPLIQNAGSVVLPDGAGSDRGSIVVGGTPFYDTDRGQFDEIEDVPAFCGAAALLRRLALEQVGAFDGSFFMYYEDTDLSLRLRRAGWRIRYAPAARVRHHHSATAVEWSPRFCYFVERNRLLMLLKNGRPKTFLREYLRYTARLVNRHETEENRKRFLLVQRSLLTQAPRAVSARYAKRKRRGAGTPGDE